MRFSFPRSGVGGAEKGNLIAWLLKVNVHVEEVWIVDREASPPHQCGWNWAKLHIILNVVEIQWKNGVMESIIGGCINFPWP